MHFVGNTIIGDIMKKRPDNDRPPIQYLSDWLPPINVRKRGRPAENEDAPYIKSPSRLYRPVEDRGSNVINLAAYAALTGRRAPERD
jgi:hypothetical protein